GPSPAPAGGSPTSRSSLHPRSPAAGPEPVECRRHWGGRPRGPVGPPSRGTGPGGPLAIGTHRSVEPLRTFPSVLAHGGESPRVVGRGKGSLLAPQVRRRCGSRSDANRSTTSWGEGSKAGASR